MQKSAAERLSVKIIYIFLANDRSSFVLRVGLSQIPVRQYVSCVSNGTVCDVRSLQHLSNQRQFKKFVRAKNLREEFSKPSFICFTTTHHTDVGKSNENFKYECVKSDTSL